MSLFRFCRLPFSVSPLSHAIHKLFWHLAVFPPLCVTCLVKLTYSCTLSMLVGRLSCRISFLVIVVVLDVPSDVNRAPLFPGRRKKKHSVLCKGLWVMVESWKEINELIPPWMSPPSVPRVKLWHPWPALLPHFSPCWKVVLEKGIMPITSHGLPNRFSAPDTGWVSFLTYYS